MGKMDRLTDRHLGLLSARGIDAELLARLGVVSCDDRGGEWIAIPFVENGTVVNHKFRTIAGQKAFRQDQGARKCFWNVDVIGDQALKSTPLVITEGEFDAMVAIQAGYVRTVSVPDGAPAEAQGERDGQKYSYLDNAPQALRDVGEIILAVDGDGPGQNLLHDLQLRLGRARCKWVKYPLDRTGKRLKDLNEVWLEYGAEGVVKTLARAQWMHVDGVYRMSELPPVPYVKPLDCGMPVLGDHYKLRRGDFVVITGIPSHGKSSVINDIACRMVAGHHWKVAFASFEQLPQTDHRRALRTWFNRKPVIDQSDAERDAADRWIDQNFTFIVPGEDDDVTLQWCLERCAAAVIQHGADMVVIDPWNEMDHVRPPDMSLTEYTGFAIKQFRKFARKHQVHVVIAAHPVKMKKLDDGKMQMPTLYDISDSSHWYNKADVGIVVHRDTPERAIIRVAKVRYHDVIGKVGDIPVAFNPFLARFEVTDGEAELL